jgi:uncharacterized protein (DUF1778 family)
LELDNANFILSKEKYEEFLTALDKNPTDKHNLRRLLNEPSIFDAK